MKDYEVKVSVGSQGQEFEVMVIVEAYDDQEAINNAENYVRNNMYIVGSDPEVIEA